MRYLVIPFGLMSGNCDLPFRMLLTRSERGIAHPIVSSIVSSLTS
jgi:hypothetical protein